MRPSPRVSTIPRKGSSEREMSKFAENANFDRRKFYKADCFQQEIRALMEKVVKHFLFFFPLDLGRSSILRFTRLWELMAEGSENDYHNGEGWFENVSIFCFILCPSLARSLWKASAITWEDIRRGIAWHAIDPARQELTINRMTIEWNGILNVRILRMKRWRGELKILTFCSPQAPLEPCWAPERCPAWPGSRTAGCSAARAAPFCPTSETAGSSSSSPGEFHPAVLLWSSQPPSPQSVYQQGPARGLLLLSYVYRIRCD